MTWDYSVSVNVWVLLALGIAAMVGVAGGFWGALNWAFRDGFLDA